MKIFDGVEIQQSAKTNISGLLTVLGLVGRFGKATSDARNRRIASERGEAASPVEEVLKQSGMEVPPVGDVISKLLGGGPEIEQLINAVASTPDIAALLQQLHMGGVGVGAQPQGHAQPKGHAQPQGAPFHPFGGAQPGSSPANGPAGGVPPGFGFGFGVGDFAAPGAQAQGYAPPHLDDWAPAAATSRPPTGGMGGPVHTPRRFAGSGSGSRQRAPSAGPATSRSYAPPRQRAPRRGAPRRSETRYSRRAEPADVPRCGRLRHVSEVGIRPGETVDFHTEFTLGALQSERMAERQETTTTGHRAADASYVVSPEGVVFPVDLGIVQDAVYAAFGAASPAPEGSSATTNASSPAEARGVASERDESWAREDEEVKPAPATSECATEPPQAADDLQKEPHFAELAQHFEDSQSALRDRMTRLEARMESLHEKLAAIVACLGEFQKSRCAAEDSTGGERHEEGAGEQGDVTSASVGDVTDSASDEGREAVASNRGDVIDGEDDSPSSCDVDDSSPFASVDDGADDEPVEVAAGADITEPEEVTPEEGGDGISEVGDEGAGSTAGEGATAGDKQAVAEEAVAQLCPNTPEEADARPGRRATVSDAAPVEPAVRRPVLGPRGAPAGMLFANSVGGEIVNSNEPSAPKCALVQRLAVVEQQLDVEHQKVDAMYEVVVHGR